MSYDLYSKGSFYRTNQGAFIRTNIGSRGSPRPLEVWSGPFNSQKFAVTGLTYPPTGVYYFGYGASSAGQVYDHGSFSVKYSSHRTAYYIDVPNRPITHAVFSLVSLVTPDRTVNYAAEVYKITDWESFTKYDFYNFITIAKIGYLYKPYDHLITRNLPPHMPPTYEELQIQLNVRYIIPGERLWMLLVTDREYAGISPYNGPTGHSYENMVYNTPYLLLDGAQQHVT